MKLLQKVLKSCSGLPDGESQKDIWSQIALVCLVPASDWYLSQLDRSEDRSEAEVKSLIIQKHHTHTYSISHPRENKHSSSLGVTAGTKKEFPSPEKSEQYRKRYS